MTMHFRRTEDPSLRNALSRTRSQASILTFNCCSGPMAG
jgi:hypothetical protein